MADQVKQLQSQFKVADKFRQKGGILQRHKKRPGRAMTNESKEEEKKKRDKRRYYGAWYLDPHTWKKRYDRQIETAGGTNIVDQTLARLGAAPPGQVGLLRRGGVIL